MVKNYDFDYQLKDFYDLNNKKEVDKVEEEISKHEQQKVNDL